MITVWDTGHPYSATIVRGVLSGIAAAGGNARLLATRDFDGRAVPSLVYGFLRGNAQIIRACAAAGVDWWFVDNGFFRPGHFAGHYRIGKDRLQPTFSASAAIDPSRWEALKLPVDPWRRPSPKAHVLVCPPTPESSGFYGINKAEWTSGTLRELAKAAPRRPVRVREKGTGVPLAQDLKGCHCVVTFNSNVAMEALLRGIPAIAERSIVRDWNRLSVADVEGDLTALDRLALFRFAASCQFRLDEFRAGGAWKTLRRLMP